MSDEPDTDDRAFAEAFRRAYQATPLPTAEEGRRAAAQAATRAAEAAVAEARQGPLGGRAWLEPSVRLSPLLALAAAAALFAGGVFVAPRLGIGPRPLAVPRASHAPGGAERVRFVFVDPHATRVALAGDFNGWDASVTRLERQPGEAAWTVTIELTPGWHAYSFVVDGERWMPDPAAPRAPEDYFGTPRSVVVVGEHGT